jgi:hypothetical protein
MEYIPSQTGLLKPEMLNTGDRIIIIEPAYSTFNEARQTTYWNAKVQMPDGSHKLAGLFESACDAFAQKWGGMTEKWVGHTIQVEKKTAKSGNEYLVMTPTDEPIVSLEPKLQPTENIDNPAASKGIKYPADEVDPNDIPF